MSYDVLVFDPAAVTDDAFSEWWDEQSAWEGEHDYNSPEVASPIVRGFFEELIRSFPPMNGPLAAPDDFEPGSRVTDYSIAPDFVYAGFAWSEAQPAADKVAALAHKHRLAIAWVGNDEFTIMRPVRGTMKWPWSR